MKLTRKTAWSLSLAHALCRESGGIPTTFASAAVQPSSKDELRLPRNRKYVSVGFTVVGGDVILVGVGARSNTERAVDSGALPDANGVGGVRRAVSEDDDSTRKPPHFERGSGNARGVYLVQDLSVETVSRIWAARRIVDSPDNNIALIEVAASGGDSFTMGGDLRDACSPFADAIGSDNDPFATYIIEAGSVMAKITAGGENGPEELYFPASDVLDNMDEKNITPGVGGIMEAYREALARHRDPKP